jgi:hypothetical protein
MLLSLGRMRGTQHVLLARRACFRSYVKAVLAEVNVGTRALECGMARRIAVRRSECQRGRCSIGVLRVEAEANTDSRPLPGFTPRRGTGLALFGKSMTEPPIKKNMRIDFQFDWAAFNIRCVARMVLHSCVR